MENSQQHHPIRIGVPPWIFIGAAVVLLPLFGFMTYETIHRQKENSIRLLMEKGAALIRSFEAGTRTGVMGTHWDSFQLQRLLTETALQPDIVYLLVTNSRGHIIAHNDPTQIGKRYGRELDLSELSQKETVIGREVMFPNDRKVFEIASRFMPSGPPVGMSPGQQQFMARFQALLESLNIPPLGYVDHFYRARHERRRKSDAGGYAAQHRPGRHPAPDRFWRCGVSLFDAGGIVPPGRPSLG